MFRYGKFVVEIADRARVSLCSFVTIRHQPLLKIPCGGQVGRLCRSNSSGSQIGHACAAHTARPRRLRQLNEATSQRQGATRAIVELRFPIDILCSLSSNFPLNQSVTHLQPSSPRGVCVRENCGPFQITRISAGNTGTLARTGGGVTGRLGEAEEFSS